MEGTHGIGVFFLYIRLRVVVADCNRNDVLERLLDRGQILLSECHRVVVELVRENWIDSNQRMPTLDESGGFEPTDSAVSVVGSVRLLGEDIVL